EVFSILSCFARPLILVNVQRSLPFFSNGGGGWSEREVFQLRRRLRLPKKAFSFFLFLCKTKRAAILI
ncbi:MAG: hypothetical protein ACLROD_05595, partial [Enterococcus faecalis]